MQLEKHHSDNDRNIKKKYGKSRQYFLNFRVVAQGFGQPSDATRKFLFYSMPVNKHALIRYHALDKCFSNFARRFYIEDLI